MAEQDFESATAPRRPVRQPAAAPERLPDLLQWSEGMLLSPQHFQQADAYWQEQLRFRIGQLCPHAWGVSALRLDQARLADGRVRILQLEGLLPDGTPVVFPGNFPAVLEIDLTAALRDDKPVRVSLVLPVRGRDIARPGAALRRYDVVQGEAEIDENTGIGLVPVDRLHPRFALWAGDDMPAQYVSCPLLEVVRDGATRAIRLGPYHPPMLRWQAAGFLGRLGLPELLRDVTLELWTKLRDLGGHPDEDGPIVGELAPSVRRRLDDARRLAAALPLLGIVGEGPGGQPVRIYEALVAMVGAVASFGLNPVPPLLEAYRHEDCRAQFEAAIAYIRRKLDCIDTVPQMLEFEHVGGRFTRALPADSDSSASGWLVELRLPEGQRLDAAARAGLARWLGDACIASEHLIVDCARLRASARPRALDADEAARRGLDGSGAIFALDNAVLPREGRDSEPLIQAGRTLVIEPAPSSRGVAPARILLCRPRVDAHRRDAPAGGRRA